MAPINLFDLYAKITLDTGDYESGIDNASEKASTFGDVLKATLTSEAIISGVKALGKAVETVASKVVGLTKVSVEQYGEYEQLVGGVETLFKGSADLVQEYAANAYKTAGLSANEYMDTVTSFSASLLQSLGNDTEAAAKKADLAITDMSDNANKMGTSMESIQNAYQGFAKANYTMLDNLKLGYGGTKEEMERLLEDASKISGIKYDISSYADIVDAIHVVQTEMGITGTTAKEAATTIQGSVNAAKSAWANLVTGIADENADLDKLIGNFVDSVKTAGENIIPRVEKIIGGIGQLVEKLAPVIAEEVPVLIATILPSFLQAGVSLIAGLASGLVSAIPSLWTTLTTAILEGIPKLADSAVEMASSMGEGLESGFPAILQSIISFVYNLYNTLYENAPKFLEAAETLIASLLQGFLDYLPTLLEWVPFAISNLASSFAENLPKIIDIAIDLIGALVVGLIQATPDLLAAIPDIVIAIADAFASLASSFVEIGVNIISGILQGIVNGIASLVQGAIDAVSSVVDGVKDFLGIHSPSRVFAGIGENMALGLGEGWDNKFSGIKRGIESGMDFGTATVDFASSGIAQANRSLTAGMVAASSASEGNIVINLTTELDGAVLARKMFRYSRDEEFLQGSFA